MNRFLCGCLFVFCIAASCAEEDNSKLDELGMIPRIHARFDGDFAAAGEESPKWEIGREKPSFTSSRGGKAVVCSESRSFPGFSPLVLGDEWTIVAIARGPDTKEDGIIWSIGSGRGNGTKALALASNGKGGVKLVTWHGRANNNTLIAMRDVVHFAKQFHVYAVTKSDSGLTLWIDGKKAGERPDADVDDLGREIRFGAFHWTGKAGGLGLGEGVAIDDFRVYDTALSEAQLLQIASGNAPWPGGLPMPKERVSAFIDTNSVLRLGYEIPERVVVGEGGEKRLYAKGVLAQCGIGGEKRFELGPGGQLALGSGALVFDSNYAKGKNCELVFNGGALLAFEPTYVKSAAPVRLAATTRLIVNKPLAIRASMEGEGGIVKTGPGVLGLQYPCDGATGLINVTTPSTLVLGPAATWGGTIELAKGATLRCVSRKQVKKIVEHPGSHVVESSPGKEYGENLFPQPATAYNFKHMQKERMGRGVYAVRQTDKEVMIGWRYKSSDPTNIAFNVYANGKKLNSAPIADRTYFKTPWKGAKTKYEVKWVVNGKEGISPVSSSWTLPQNAPVGYFDIELAPPPDDTLPDGKTCGHIPYDCTVGDLDGDGEYELVVLWWPENGADNSSWHVTGKTWIEGVKLDGTNRSLWKIDLGINIRSGSHYVPVMVCDMDGDGKAEVVCRTADGTKDAAGRIIGSPTADFREKNGHVLWAQNFVTVFDGATGRAIDSVPFKPDVLSDQKKRANRDEKAINKEWSSRNPGNQAFRMLSAVAYLDGVHPSVVMCRGYYSRTCLCAYDFDGKNLSERWFFCSDDPRWWGYGGQGFHNLRVGDVDFDGKDEIVYGHMVVDHDGQGLITTGGGHGDAIHLIQSAPDQRGLKVWSCHESAPYGVSLWDAQTGRIILHRDGPQDTGSCNAMDIDPDAPGVELFSGCNLGIYSASTLEQYPRPKPNPRDNYYGTLRFGIWWHGNMARSAYSGGSVIKDYSTKGRSVWPVIDFGPDVHSNHGTKGCPNLIADLFGDWREEMFLTRKDNKAIRVFMSPEDTPYRFHTFMEDPVYRISVLTQNNGYNVPTDPGFYFGPDLLGHGIWFRGTYLK